MRLSSPLSIVAVFAVAASLRAQQPSMQYVRAPGCEAPRYDCQPQCSAPPYSPPAAPPQAPTGYYAAPPQNGVLEGASTSVEVEGATLRFPALEFKFPGLRLPCLSKIHKNPRMHIDAARAPYVQQPMVAYGAPIAVQPVATPPAVPPQQNPPQHGPPSFQPPACDAPRSYPPNCDAAAIEGLKQQLRLRDQRIEVLDQQIARMATSMERLAEIVERIPATSAAMERPSQNLVIREPRPQMRLAPTQPNDSQQPGFDGARWPVAPATYSR